VLEEQRRLEPPPEIGAVLEQCSADAGRVQEQMPTFGARWQTSVQTAQTADVREDVAELVQLQVAASDAGRKLADEAGALAEQLGQRVEALAQEGSGGTRAVVVAAVLRSEHTALATGVNAFRAAAAKMVLTENPDLEVQDRKVRGLRTRLASAARASPSGCSSRPTRRPAPSTASASSRPVSRSAHSNASARNWSARSRQRCRSCTRPRRPAGNAAPPK